MPQTYANLMHSDSTSLPRLTRNYSAAFNTANAHFNFSGEDASTAEAALQGHSRMSGKHKARN